MCQGMITLPSSRQPQRILRDKRGSQRILTETPHPIDGTNTFVQLIHLPSGVLTGLK